MTSTIVLGLVLTGPLPLELVAAAPRTPGALREAYREALQDSAKRVRPDYAEVVPRIAALYVELASAEGFSAAERSQMRGRLHVRLEEIQGRLLREQAADARTAARDRYRERNRPAAPAVRTPGPAAPAGGTPAAARHTPAGGGVVAARNAQQLIDLIQNTIAPESWNVNGGRGSISYYPMFQALVVRQTAEVHHQLGSGLGQLRR